MADSNSEKEIITAEEPESIIKITLDTLNIRKIIKIIFNKIHIVSTPQFIDGLLLFIFLILIYNYANILILDLSWPMLILYIILILVIFDFLAANVDRIKGFLFTEEKNRLFLQNVRKFSDDQVKSQSRIRKFTPNNIDYFLNLIREDKRKNNEYLFENMLIRNPLSPENLDIIFTSEILQFCREKLIIQLLMNYRNFLSKTNLINLYNYFKPNENIIKLIFATQNQSEFLLTVDLENSKIKDYFKKFQINKTPNFLNLEKKLPKDSSYNPPIGYPFVAIWIILFFSLNGILLFFNIPYPWEGSDMSFIITLIGVFTSVLSAIITYPIGIYLMSHKQKTIQNFIEYVLNNGEIS